MPNLNRPSCVLYRHGVALALAIASSACHDDRTLGEIVDSNQPGFCAGAPCDGWCERPRGACDAPSTEGTCRPSLTPDERNTLLERCARNVPADGSSLVCGCNGQTYARDCERLASQMSVFGAGRCPGLACLDTKDCGAGQFCEFMDGSCKGEGSCQTGGPGAPAILCNPDPRAVCGCDGKTYRSECERRRAGVSKFSDGPCDGMTVGTTGVRPI